MPANDRLDVPGEFGGFQEVNTPFGVPFDHGEFRGGERTGLIQDLVGHPHIAHVVQVGPDPYGHQVALVEAQDACHAGGEGSHPFGTPVGVAVGRLNRLTPAPDHLQERPLDLGLLPRDVDPINPSGQPAEQPVCRIQLFEGFQAPPQVLIQEGQLAFCLRLLERVLPVGRELDGEAQVSFGQGRRAGLSIDHAQEAIDSGLPGAVSDSIEHAERRVGTLPGVLVVLAGDEHFRLIQQAEGLEVDVSELLGDGAAPPVITIRVVPLFSIGAHHPHVMIRPGAPVVVPRRKKSLDRSLAVLGGSPMVAAHVGHDRQVLLDPTAECLVAVAQLERFRQTLAGGVMLADIDIEAREGVERLSGERLVAEIGSEAVAPGRSLTGGLELSASVTRDGQPPERLDKDQLVAFELRRTDRRLVGSDGLEDPPVLIKRPPADEVALRAAGGSAGNRISCVRGFGHGFPQVGLLRGVRVLLTTPPRGQPPYQILGGLTLNGVPLANALEKKGLVSSVIQMSQWEALRPKQKLRVSPMAFRHTGPQSGATTRYLEAPYVRVRSLGSS